MRLAWISIALISLTACGKEIGDECNYNDECDPEGNRVCDLSSSGGYCTIIGCEHDSCPESSVCVRFYVASFENLPCAPATEDITTDDCSADEVCALEGQCVPSNAEIRFCMATCGGDSDCRDGYECRNEELMRAHGGEPVPPPGDRVGSKLTPFCAEAPSS